MILINPPVQDGIQIAGTIVYRTAEGNFGDLSAGTKLLHFRLDVHHGSGQQAKY